MDGEEKEGEIAGAAGSPVTSGNAFLNGASQSPGLQICRESLSAEEMSGRIHYLEELVAEKEAALIAVTQELDAVREMSCIDASIGPLPTGFDVDFKASIAECNRKLQEQASALCQRDEMIQKLADTLKQSVQDREKLKEEAGRLANQVHSLQAQLHSVGQHVQQPQTKLLEALKEKDTLLQKKAEELCQLKAQSSKEVQFLMSSLESLQQRAAKNTSVSPPPSKCHDDSDCKYLKELNDWRQRYDLDLRQSKKQLTEARNSELLLKSQLEAARQDCGKLSLDISSLKLAHETQISVCREQHELSDIMFENTPGEMVPQNLKSLYMKTHQKLQEETRRVVEFENHIQLLQMQLTTKDEICRKQEETIQSLQDQTSKLFSDKTAFQQTLEQLTAQSEELKKKHSEDLTLKENELMVSNQLIAEMKEDNAKQLQSMHQNLNRMKQHQLEEVATSQLSHENEINTIKRDAERYRTELQEKNNLLTERNKQLNEEQQWSKTYSQQVQELGEKLGEEESKNEDYRGKIGSLERHLKGIDEACTLYQPQIEFLQRQIEDERKKTSNILQELDDMRKQLVTEQEKCKVYCGSLETANKSIIDLQRENSEMKLHASEIDQTLQLTKENGQQLVATMQKEISMLEEKLKTEQNHVESCESEIVGQKNTYQELLKLLESEKQSASRYRSQAESLQLQLHEEKSKYYNDHQNIQLQLREKENQIRVYELQVDELKRKVSVSESSDKNQITAQMQGLQKNYVSQLESLEQKVQMLSETNVMLRKEREESETELAKFRQLYSDGKTEFDIANSRLRQELAQKEEEMIELRKRYEDMYAPREELNACNRQIKELLSSKELLENELTSLKQKYLVDIGSLRDQVIRMENKLRTSNKLVDDAAIEGLVQRCQEDLKFLHSLQVSIFSSSKVDEWSAGPGHTQNDSDGFIPGLRVLISGFVSLCEDLVDKNRQLKNSVSEIQDQLAQNESCVTKTALASEENDTKGTQDICACGAKFAEERNILKCAIESLQREVLEKTSLYEEKIKSILEKSHASTELNIENDDNFVNLIRDSASKAKDIVMLQNQLKKVQIENQSYLCEQKRLQGQLQELDLSLKASLQKYSALKKETHSCVRENNITRARLKRIETFEGFPYQDKRTSKDLLWQLIEDFIKQKHSEIPPSERGDSSVLDRIDSVVKIINKMNSDCEALLAKYQSDGDNCFMSGYLQSEGLGLRRLQTALFEIEQIITTSCKPALQLHVDLLKQQLESKEVAYQSICDAHFALEAEMREMEDRFCQQEELLQEQLLEYKAAAEFWQLKLQAIQVHNKILNPLEFSCEDDFLKFCCEMDAAYSQVLDVLHDEVRRVSSLRDDKAHLDVTEKLVDAERNHKLQLEELRKQIHCDNNVKALQVLHQQELHAIRVESDYSQMKTIHMLQQQLQSSLYYPPKVKPNSSFIELSLLFMKHNISLQYNLALRKISDNLKKELVQKLSFLQEEPNSSSHYSEFETANVPEIKLDSISSMQDFVAKAKEFVERVLEMQKVELEKLLSTCQKNHNIILNDLQKMTSEFHDFCDVKNLQEELLKTKEEHKLALESLSSSHKAEVSRLRLLLSQQNNLESPDPSETAITVMRRELEEKHKRQMEELRTYFEQKCADFEKHYSEEVFSQHSRKLSDCSSASESELVSEMYYAGPGLSSCSGPGAPSYFCDVLGESSFKDLEESTRTVDLEKLFADNREQIETMRLALESRHQGELEAQKELYEARVEELLCNMNDSHAAELKLKNKQLEDLQEELTSLTTKQSETEKEIFYLKEQLQLRNSDSSYDNKRETQHSCDNITTNQSQFLKDSEKCRETTVVSTSQLEEELQRMKDILKLKDSESSAKIASLKLKLRQNHEEMSKLEKDLSNLRSKYDSDAQSWTSLANEKVKQIEELSLKVQELSTKLEESSCLNKQLSAKIADECCKLKKEYEGMLQRKDEECESKIIALRSELDAKYSTDMNLKEAEMQKILEESVNSSVEERRLKIESEFEEYLEFVKKCADDTKAQLVLKHENETKQIIDKYEKELLLLKTKEVAKVCKHPQNFDGQQEKPYQNSLQNLLNNKDLNKESSICCCMQDLLKLSNELDLPQQEQLENILVKLCQEESNYRVKLHQDLEIRLEYVQKESERRFHLQLEEARRDIVRALEQQIQQLLDDDSGASERPVELQQLEEKFAAKYQQKLNDLQTDYEKKISELCSKHSSQLSYARNKQQAVNELPITTEELDKLCKERDCLRSVAATLRDIVAELVRYFMSWEDDFNNTLMDELAKFETGRGNDLFSVTHDEDSTIDQTSDDARGNLSANDDEMPVVIATPARGRHMSSSVKHVHFAPDMSGILSFIDDESLFENVGLNLSVRNASLNFQEELDRCLARLRSDSAALYALSKPVLPSMSSEVSLSSDAEKSEVCTAGTSEKTFQRVAQLQKENEKLEDQYHKTLAELEAANQRIDALEQEARRQAEVVAEGYGEGDKPVTSDTPISGNAPSVEELQNKARMLLLESSTTEDVLGAVSPTSRTHVPHILEELCRDWERLAEESRLKQYDLQQQVDVADKQLRATRAFMDEQASEREQERDEFMHEIEQLRELLRDKDRDRSSQQHMNHEVEDLEGQLKETHLLLKETQEKLERLNAEHKQAVEKIWNLRDIISDLEVQVATKAEEAASVSAQNTALHQMVEQQGKTQLQLAQEMEELQLYADNGKLSEKISQLEEQLCKHQLLAEQLGDPNAVHQMRIQLQDLGSSLELHTKELECAYASATLPASPCLSSPSEDVSIRETLEAIKAANDKRGTTENTDNLVLPFNEVSRVMELWQRHARADDAILKRVRDLDMQWDDVHAEKETLGAHLQEQMLLSSSLQAKLDEHRRKADVKLSEAIAEMQSQVEDLRNEVHNYAESLESKDKQIENLKSTLRQLEANLRKREAEIRKNVESERIVSAQLQSQISKLSEDKSKLEMELSSHYVATPSTTLEFEYSESDKVRAHVALSPLLELRRSLSVPTIDESDMEKRDADPCDASPLPKQMSLQSIVELGVESDISMKPVPVEETLPPPNLSNGSASDTLSSLVDTFDSSSLSSCEKRVAALQDELKEKSKIIEDYKEQIMKNSVLISELEEKVKFVADSELKLSKMAELEHELTALKLLLQNVTDKKTSDQELEVEAKRSEVQSLRDEVCATQAILANLQRKVQEAKQIARSPSRSSPENNQTLRAVQNELEAAKREIVELKDLCRSIKSEVESEYQTKQSQFEQVLIQEQQAKQSLLDALDKIQQQNKAGNVGNLEELLKGAKRELTTKENENLKLQSELKQLNMECVTLKQQLSTPIAEVTALTKKLDAEKRFADALKEELLTFKSQAFSLDEDCKLLREKLKMMEGVANAGDAALHVENQKLMKEVSELKSAVDSLQNNHQTRVEKLSHKNALLQEENVEVGKELSDMKQIIIQMRGSLDEAQTLLQSKTHELHEMRSQRDGIYEELSLLRQALKNIHVNLEDFSKLGYEDSSSLRNIQKQLRCANLKGAGDGPWNKLTFSEMHVHEIRPEDPPLEESESLDDLTDLVQHEVDVSVQLDCSLLQTIDPTSSRKSISTREVDGKHHSGKDVSVPHPGLQNSAETQTRNLENESHIRIFELEEELKQMKAEYYKLQQQDCELIKEMRLKLSEALDEQATLRLQLETGASQQQVSLVKAQEGAVITPKSKRNLPVDSCSDVLQAQLTKASAELLKVQDEKDAVVKQLRRLQEVEIQRSRRRAETEQKYRCHIDQLQSLQAQTQQESVQLRQELSAVNQKLHLAQEEFLKERNAQLQNHTPFVERLKKMNTFLEEHIEENQRMAKQMEELTEEHRRLRHRIADLEGQLVDRRSNESFEAANARFAAERAEWETEQKHLLSSLNEAKHKRFLCGDSELEDRVNHLFGRYLRAQSYRKALIWQKRYLLSVITGLNESKSLAASHLSGFVVHSKQKPPKGLQKFRSAVMVIIAIHRMQFMVERWIRGKRIGCGVVVQQTLSQYSFSSSTLVQGQSSVLPTKNLPASTAELRSSLSQSPPTLERPRQPRSQPPLNSYYSRFPVSRGLGSASSLNNCVTSFNLAQQRFDTLFSNPPK